MYVQYICIYIYTYMYIYIQMYSFLVQLSLVDLSKGAHHVLEATVPGEGGMTACSQEPSTRGSKPRRRIASCNTVGVQTTRSHNLQQPWMRDYAVMHSLWLRHSGEGCYDSCSTRSLHRTALSK